MPIPTNPPVLESPIGTSADVFAIPSQTDSGSGALSYRDGWPAITGISLKAGGLAPQREYFNAVNKLLSQHTFFQQSGGVYPWTPALDYIAGAHVLGSNGLEYVAVAPSGPDVSGTGAKDPTASGNSSYWLLLAARIMSTQGGLVVNPSTGQASVDFSQMPDSVLQKLLQQIKVPYWLKKNTNFYVNGATGSDTLDDGRGESEGKPFKTIQACINYVTDNYNVSRYTAYINVENTAKYAPITLPDFSRTTGGIVIRGKENAPFTIAYEGTDGACIACSAGTWTVDHANIRVSMKDDPSALSQRLSVALRCTSGRLYANNVNIDMEYADTANSKSHLMRAINCSGGEVVVYNMAIAMRRQNQSVRLYPFVVSAGGSLRFPDTNNSPGYKCTLSGSFVITAYTFNTGRITCNGGGLLNTYTFEVSGSVTGKRYTCTQGSNINTYGQGPDYFPGDTPGTVEASTYCWYA